VLDAAAALFLRLGYTHMSTGAIAAKAGVSKATLYAYWPSKARLFHALVVRESLRVFDAWEAGIAADPQGGTVGPLLAHGFRALAASPVLWALYTRDTATLSDLFRWRGPALYTPRYLENLTFVRELQTAGIVRGDLPAETVNHLMQALSFGLVTAGELVDPAVIPHLDAIAATLAETMQGALAPPTPAPSERGKRVIMAYFARLRALMIESLAAGSQGRHEGEQDDGADTR
jgi:AcrR family transcriptional regulator